YDREANDHGEDLNGVAAGQIPLWFDIGARLGGHVFVGGYFQYGFVVLADRISNDCEDADNAPGVSASCSAQDLRLGANVHYHFGGPGASLDPWIGGGLGYEWFGFSESLSFAGQSVD